jgi:hypothetical protein
MKAKRSAGISILLTMDGSTQAHAALEVAAAFPWGKIARAHLVLARGGLPLGLWRPDVWVAGTSGTRNRAVDRELSRARRLVRRRWPEVSAAAGPACDP